MATSVLLLQVLAFLPFLVQRMFVRFAQPFFLFGLIYMGTLILENVMYTAIVSVVLFLVISYLSYIYFLKRRHHNIIAPISPNDIIDEIISVDFQLDDDKINSIKYSSTSNSKTTSVKGSEIEAKVCNTDMHSSDNRKSLASGYSESIFNISDDKSISSLLNCDENNNSIDYQYSELEKVSLRPSTNSFDSYESTDNSLIDFVSKNDKSSYSNSHTDTASLDMSNNIISKYSYSNGSTVVSD